VALEGGDQWVWTLEAWSLPLWRFLLSLRLTFPQNNCDVPEAIGDSNKQKPT
jgi:hypothetical protein